MNIWKPQSPKRSIHSKISDLVNTCLSMLRDWVNNCFLHTSTCSFDLFCFVYFVVVTFLYYSNSFLQKILITFCLFCQTKPHNYCICFHTALIVTFISSKGWSCDFGWRDLGSRFWPKRITGWSRNFINCSILLAWWNWQKTVSFSCLSFLCSFVRNTLKLIHLHIPLELVNVIIRLVIH